MTRKPIATESLLSLEVHDPSGKSAGRIEEIRATPSEDALLVYQYDLGPAALLERLAVRLRSLRLLKRLGIGPGHSGRCVSWEKMDLSDPRHPRLACPREELRPLED